MKSINITHKTLIALTIVIIIIQLITSITQISKFYSYSKENIIESAADQLVYLTSELANNFNTPNNYEEIINKFIQLSNIEISAIAIKSNDAIINKSIQDQQLQDTINAALKTEVPRIVKQEDNKYNYITYFQHLSDQQKITVCIAINNNKIWHLLRKVIKTSIIINVITLIGAMVIIYYILSRLIINKLKNMRDIMQKISKNDFTPIISMTDDRNEFGDIMRTVSAFKDRAFENNILEIEREKETLKREKDKKIFLDNAINLFKNSVMKIIADFLSTAMHINEKAATLSDSANTSSQKSAILKNVVAESSININHVATSTEKLSQSIAEVKKQIIKSKEISTKAVERVGTANKTVSNLNEASSKIGEVLETINSIAAQISLLALNATIEAARAGEAGKGFSVVASEVKNLASQTSQATEEIIKVINTMQQETVNTVNAMESITQIISEVNLIANNVTEVFVQQSHTISDISHSAIDAAQNSQKVINETEVMLKTAVQNGDDSKHLVIMIKEITDKAQLLESELQKFVGSSTNM